MECRSTLRRLKTRFALQVDENSCAVSISFDGGKYSDTLIKSFADSYKHVITKIFNAEKIGDIDWLSADEQKINKKALPEPVLQVEAEDKKIAATDLQKTLCGMFAKALGRKNIGADEKSDCRKVRGLHFKATGSDARAG
ncbi:MAG: hypothetical protein IJK81_09420 [Selenomonadaceae bacterium]|nr:hypothetical protein [Selenomonadaceae bacterium]